MIIVQLCTKKHELIQQKSVVTEKFMASIKWHYSQKLALQTQFYASTNLLLDVYEILS